MYYCCKQNTTIMKRKLKNETIEEYVDPETGEHKILTKSKHYSIAVKDSEKFYMVFFENLASFYQINSTKQIFLLSKLCEMAEYNTGSVDLSSNKRKKLIEHLKIDKSYLSRCLKSLVNKNLIVKEGTNIVINPKVFWKGSTNERDKVLKEGLDFKITFKMK